jgi:hypothetical protein
MDRMLDLVEAIEAAGIPIHHHRLRRRPGHQLQRRHATGRQTRCGPALLARSTHAAFGDRKR